MRRALLCLLIVFTAFSLCGCSLRNAVSAEAQEHIVSALGFEEENGEIKMYVEAVIINSEDPEAEKKTKLVEGKGDTVKSALNEILSKTVQPLMFSHCGVIITENGISAKRFKEICDYIYSEEEITISVFMATTKDVKQLLSSEPISSISMGYDIINSLESFAERTGTNLHNRYYEISAAMKKTVNVFLLPDLTTEEQNFKTNGAVVFYQNKPVLKLDNQQTAVFGIAADFQKAGEIFLEDNLFKIRNSTSLMTVSLKDKPTVKLTVDLKLKSGKKGEKKKILEDEIYSLFSLSQKNGVDILGVGNMLYRRENKIWDKLKKDYVNQYKNFAIKVEIK